MLGVLDGFPVLAMEPAKGAAGGRQLSRKEKSYDGGWAGAGKSSTRKSSTRKSSTGKSSTGSRNCP